MTREEAIFTLQEAVDEAFGAGIEIITRDGCEAIEIAIEALQEHKTGKWLDRTICSNCNWYATNRYGLAVDSYFPYCPNCGAKMEVDE